MTLHEIWVVTSCTSNLGKSCFTRNNCKFNFENLFRLLVVVYRFTFWCIFQQCLKLTSEREIYNPCPVLYYYHVWHWHWNKWIVVVKCIWLWHVKSTASTWNMKSDSMNIAQVTILYSCIQVTMNNRLFAKQSTQWQFMQKCSALFLRIIHE